MFCGNTSRRVYMVREKADNNSGNNKAYHYGQKFVQECQKKLNEKKRSNGLSRHWRQNTSRYAPQTHIFLVRVTFHLWSSLAQDPDGIGGARKSNETRIRTSRKLKNWKRLAALKLRALNNGEEMNFLSSTNLMRSLCVSSVFTGMWMTRIAPVRIVSKTNKSIPRMRTVENENSSFIVWNVGDQDRIRFLRRYRRTHDLIYVGDSNENWRCER